MNVLTPSAPPGAPKPGYYLLELMALQNDDARQAVDLLAEGLKQEPNHAGLRRNLVRALLLEERWEEVLVLTDADPARSSRDAEHHFARGTAQNGLGQPAKACASFAKALSMRPDHAASWLNMGNASADLDDLQSAETLYRTALRIDPSLREAHASLGYVLTRLGRLEEAVQACETAIGLFPDFAQAHWNLAAAALLAGDLKRGFAAYEWRKRHPRYRADFPPLPGPLWDGSDPTDRTILVRSEQGFGDTIQFARYLPMIAARGGRPLLTCEPSLLRLLETMPGVAVCDRHLPPPVHDAWIDIASLPFVFGTSPETIPTPSAYLRADPVSTEIWQRRLPRGCKVGVVFSGNPRHPGDRRRSIPLDQVQLPNIPGVSFVDLQLGATTLGLDDLTPWMTDYAETAALISNLDLVVSVDTSVAHLAGALGKPVWILLPHAPDWRWQLGRSDSPWYQSARLFRQSAPGDWPGVLADVFDALRGFSSSAINGQAGLSPGCSGHSPAAHSLSSFPGWNRASSSRPGLPLLPACRPAPIRTGHPSR